MEVKGKHAYAQGVEAVFKSFGDPARIESRFRALGARNIAIESCQRTPTSLDMQMRREVPVDAPTLLKKFLGEWNMATQEEHWKGSAAKGYAGEIRITLKGVPVTITGTLFLSGDAHQCVNDITMRFESGIPLVGKKLAEFVGNTAAQEMQREYEFIRDSF